MWKKKKRNEKAHGVSANSYVLSSQTSYEFTLGFAALSFSALKNLYALKTTCLNTSFENEKTAKS